MTPITFSGYGVLAPQQTVIAERITNWYPIEYNGNPGTCICLDNGSEIKVGDQPWDVERIMKRAMRDKGEPHG